MQPDEIWIGIISKNLTDQINLEVKAKLNCNMWGNIAAVIKWFIDIGNRQQYSFIIFDVIEFYPSISRNLLSKALDLAAKFPSILCQDRHIIHYTRNSLLYHSQQPWGENIADNMFDITKGSCDGVETREMVCLFLLHSITAKHGHNFSLYRDGAWD